MTSTDALTALHDAGIPAFLPGSSEYTESTSPENTAATQDPALVARPRTAAEVSATVRAAAAAGLAVAVQSTGHGDGEALGEETLLVDTRALDSVDVDPAARTAVVGTGARWGDVQAAAFTHGLLGLSGTSATVGVSGYTFGGGVGWLTRPHGLASAALRSVTFVDGTGRIREASATADDADDREALWAFRGGRSVGLATSLEIDLVTVPSLWAGYLLWPAADASAVVAAWAAALPDLADDVTSTISLLHLPPEGPFPPSLLGEVVVHLSLASPSGPGGAGGAAALVAAVRAAATPVLDTGGPSDLERLVGIHLDPPGGNPARGTGAWLGASAGSADEVLRILHSARIGDPEGLMMIELRHLAAPPSDVDGAMTSLPGPFLVHAVGAGDAASRPATERALAVVDQALASVGTGLDAVSFRDGSPSAGTPHPPEVAARLAAVARRLDPAGVFRFSRVV